MVGLETQLEVSEVELRSNRMPRLMSVHNSGVISCSSSLDQDFRVHVLKDLRGESLDRGNIRLAYDSVSTCMHGHYV